jgi:ABC-type multidrug transport system fused ATPase/permease subunit
MSKNSVTRYSTIRACLDVFSKKDKQKIFAVVVIQTFLGALDLLGVIFVGIIGALAVTGIQSNSPGNRVSRALNFLGLEGFTLQQQTAVLGLVAAFIFVGRTILSVLFTRKILFFIGRRSAIISGSLVTRVLQLNNLEINRRTVQETIYATTTGVVAVTLGVVGTLVAIIADVSLLLVMACGLLFIDPLVATSTFLLFAGVGLGLFKLMQNRAINLGNRDAQLNVLSNERISEVLTSYREATVRSRKSYYAHEIAEARYRLSDVLAELAFLPSISKYVIEGTMIVGGVIVAALQFALQDSRHAVATLAVFLAAGTRIAPAILRVQQGSLLIKSNLGSAKSTLELIATLPESGESHPVPIFQDSYPELEANIEVVNVSFTYPGSEISALTDINLSIREGSTCAIVGPSGSGKTTLADLILGMFDPTSGRVTIANHSPSDILKRFPGAIAYVPQDVSIINGTIRENVALGFPISEATDARILWALKTAQLEDLINSLPLGVDSPVGPRGAKLSGGQRQRLGIARAIFTKPLILVLDESTSALDVQTELDVSKAITEIPYPVTKLVIAHRLSTVQNADQVVYIQDGVVLATGKFDEIRQKVPNFDIQAKLLGL